MGSRIHLEAGRFRLRSKILSELFSSAFCAPKYPGVFFLSHSTVRASSRHPFDETSRIARQGGQSVLFPMHVSSTYVWDTVLKLG